MFKVLEQTVLPVRRFLSREEAKIAFMCLAKLNGTQFKKAKETAGYKLSLIDEKYPKLKGYLVFCRGGDQVDLDSFESVLFKKLPNLFLAGEAKLKLEKLVKEEPSEKASSETKSKWSKGVKELSPSLQFDGEVQVEMRFKKLDYESLWKLQRDDLIDLHLTPQTRASIRIVLGTLSSILGQS